MNIHKNLKGNLILMITAIIWGVSFVSQSVGMDFIGPCTFNGIRTLLGAVVLIPFILFSDKKNNFRKMTEKEKHDLILGGITCGVLLCIASTIQTLGIKYTTTAKSGFITAMYIIFVPFTGFFMKKKVGIVTYAGALIALAGLYMLCMSGESLNINIGDILTLVCAIFFTFHILAVDYFSARVNGVKLACLQFFVSGIINIILMLILEKPDFTIVKSCWMPILYSGIMSCGMGYTLQIIGQKYTDPTPAAIIMSMEAVFAALAGFVLLNESLEPIQILGCIVMFAAILIVQIPPKKKI